ncbi:hypothetical protein [Pediococcus pentosaceus]|uniref:hypothetical protein n=1 Tax=Pediococcus pentosaceus TaxID=1255 RepID=UPI000C07743B|nr:hypothetical protein [Pediococcus pentosaceus]
MSKPYMLSYDLDAPGQKYDQVRDTIKNFSDSCVRLQKSFWLLRSSLTPDEMTDKLKEYFDDNDRLFICEITNNRQGLASEDEWKFLRENIFID